MLSVFEPSPLPCRGGAGGESVIIFDDAKICVSLQLCKYNLKKVNSFFGDFLAQKG
jgi:hypothetical protein